MACRFIPAPDRLSQRTEFGPFTRKASAALGERLTRPSGAAVATKKNCCASTKRHRFDGILLSMWPIPARRAAAPRKAPVDGLIGNQ